MILTKDLKVELNMADFTTAELILELNDREENLLKKLPNEDLTEELARRKFDFCTLCEEEHFDDATVKQFEKLKDSNPSAGGHELDMEIITRFIECHHLLTWEQWNHMLCNVTKMSPTERQMLARKYDKL